MPLIPESSSDLSDTDQLSYESDSKSHTRATLRKSPSQRKYISDEEVDELESEEEIEYSEEEQELPKRKIASVVKHKKSNGKGKLIEFEAVNILKGDKSVIDKFISSRINGENQAEEVLVKYKVQYIYQNMSFYHVEWLPVANIEKDKNCRVRLRRFLEKSVFDLQWSEDEPFNPSYVKIDRIIDDGELDGVLHYLVKWGSQPYDQSTWESEVIVQELDAEKIQDFHINKTYDDEKGKSYLAPGRRIPNSRWKKLQESPKYKDGNSLRSYQLEGLNWLMFCWFNNQNSILADEMGLGKTVQSTAFLYQLYKQEKMQGPFLIIVPLSTMGNWERELRGWTDMNTIVFHGNQISRNLIVETEFYYRDNQGAMIPGVYKFDVLLTTYEMAMSGASQLRPIHWRCAVLDEAHRLKNKSSKVTEFLKTYSMEHRVLLTGTPLQNSLDELWALLNFLEPVAFASEIEFQEQYGAMSTAADVEKLQALLKPLMLRRLKEDVEKSIPVKEETVVEVELTTTQKKWYRSILERNFSWLKQAGKKNVPNMINTMIELRKCCIHPWLLKGAEDEILSELNCGDSAANQIQALVQSSGKMVLIDKLLKKLKIGGHKVLIFSQMTKCLDLIQEYIRAMEWQFERIDGNVRGEYRQAAIDRFSAPGSESFVFLLCTRAGGVGINLTAADTCIIFDSDWNPQNDLQAQSRCHRIGQKKAVKIYRLITRNTYEREMFDRASMKLGLDKALLQKMEGKGGTLDPFGGKSKSGSSGLSKAEVEDLLKKGAYGAFMDDGAGDKFCEEDIEQILERRTMVIRHDGNSEARKGSMFSKASFQAAGSSDTVDVNDPDFWDKFKEQAQLKIVEEIQDDPLVMDIPRVRKPVARFEANGEVDNDRSDDYKPIKIADVKPWTNAERTRLERCIMQHGFFHFEKITSTFTRRSSNHLRACIRALILRCLQTCTAIEKEVLVDVKRALAIFYPAEPYRQDISEEDVIQTVLELEDPLILEIRDENLPTPGCDDREKFEYQGFLKEAPADFLENLSKKAKNLLIRVALMFNIRHRNRPNSTMNIPSLISAPPAKWWGSVQDRDLLIGICRHGYQQYSQIWSDPELCFFKIFRAIALDQSAQGADIATIIESILSSDKVSEEVSDIRKGEGDSEKDIPDFDTEIIDEEAELESINDADSDSDVEMQQLDHIVTYHNDKTLLAHHDFHIPTPTELGVRIRRILNALTKHLLEQSREQETCDANNEKIKEKEFRRLEKARFREFDLSKKHKLDFQRTILYYGIPKVSGSPLYDWTQFKFLAELTKKSDQVLESYWKNLLKLSNETIKYHEDLPTKTDSNPDVLKLDSIKPDSSEVVESDILEGKLAPDYPKGEDDEFLTVDRAKKIVKRIVLYEDLRTKVMIMDELASKLSTIPGLERVIMPTWWKLEYDFPFLTGVDRYGLNRSDLFVEADDLPFKTLYNAFLECQEAQNIGNDRSLEKFWMRDSISVKRVELLVAMSEKPQRPSKKSYKKIKPSHELHSDGLDSGPLISARVAKKAKVKTSSLKNTDSAVQENLASGVAEKPKYVDNTYNNNGVSGFEVDDVVKKESQIRGFENSELNIGSTSDLSTSSSYQKDRAMMSLDIDRPKSTYLERGNALPFLKSPDKFGLPPSSSYHLHQSPSSSTLSEHGYIPMPAPSTSYSSFDACDSNNDYGKKRLLDDIVSPVKKNKLDEGNLS